MIHSLKSWPIVFQQVLDGVKTDEFRENDRDYKTGDTLELLEWDYTAEAFTGRACRVDVTCITYGPAFGIPEGFCVMSILNPSTVHRGLI